MEIPYDIIHARAGACICVHVHMCVGAPHHHPPPHPPTPPPPRGGGPPESFKIQ